ncbi:MAG: hypothetical protein PUK86_09340, partial [bacterium]|nr:hypothetical protein [bacterium]
RERIASLGENARKDAKQAEANWYAVADNLPGILAAAGNQALRDVQTAIATPSPEPTATPSPPPLPNRPRLPG